MRFILHQRSLLFCLASIAIAAERPKVKDAKGKPLVDLSEVPTHCDASNYLDFGIVNGSLERCSHWLAAQQGSDAQRAEYEQRKCTQLRLNGQLEGSTCACVPKWKGPTCTLYHGCPDGHSLTDGLCSLSWCRNNGRLAVSELGLDCICPAPWDGKRCERLACWRKESKQHERRWRNSGTVCVCGEGYEGESCERVTSCRNGALDESAARCVCTAGFHGERCEHTCKPNAPCSTPLTALSPTLAALAATATLLLALR